MDMKPTQKDRKVFGYVCENFSCYICNNILIQCVTLSCGHNFCHYCLDLYLGGNPLSQSCPQCNLQISHVHPNASIDQKIDNLLSTCSEQIQQAYATALDLRFRKAVERSKQRHNQKIDSKMGNMLDEICSKIKTESVGADTEVEATKVLKSARKKALATARNSSAARKTLSAAGQKNASELDIDMDKVNSLFGIYDHVLKNGNEPNQPMAGGDFAREQEQIIQEMENPPLINLEGMKNFTKKNEKELEELIKEADDIVKLDDHIHKWSKKMKDALTDNRTGLPDEKVDKKMHKVNDQLWRASNELLERLEGVRKQGRALQKTRDISCTIPIPALPPKPRSAKLDLKNISDDSDAEEYEEALKKLQVCLDEDTDVEAGGDINFSNVKDDLVEKKTKEPSKQTTTASRKKSILDCVEESGNEYIKENIDFIMQMRRYKEALMRIQNHEVETAQEIRELLPKTSYSQPQSTSSMELPEARARESRTPRPCSMGHSSSSHMLGMRPLSRSGYTSRHQPFSVSTRLPTQVPPPPLSRPMTATAGSFGMSSSPTTLPNQQLQRHSLSSIQTKQQQNKSLRRGTQKAAQNPLYTVR